MNKSLLIDHYDSFSWNVKAWLAQYFNVQVISYSNIQNIDPSLYKLIVLSPGPKHPKDYSETLKFLTAVRAEQAVLGICLGMQCMAYHSHNSVRSYEQPFHGKTSQIKLKFMDGSIHEFTIARYHSLKCHIVNEFDILAKVEPNLPMIIKHKTKNWLGFQFHPESFLTSSPDLLIKYIKENLNL